MNRHSKRLWAEASSGRKVSVTETLTPRSRKVRILATLGPASSDAKMIRKLMLAGADAFRINMSHGDKRSKARLVDAIRALSPYSRREVQDVTQGKPRVARLWSLDALCETQPDSAYLADRSSSPENVASEREMLAALEKLPAREREVVVLRDLEGHSGPEAGEALGVTESRICQLRKRALATLRDALALEPACEAA